MNIHSMFTREPGEPIIQSLLDLDWYCLTIAQWAWLYDRETRVRFGLTNRNKREALAQLVPLDLIRSEMDHARTLRPTAREMQYLTEVKLPFSKQKVFRPDFLAWFSTVQLPGYDLGLTPDGRNPRIENEAFWAETLLWETIKLSIVNQLRGEAYMAREGISAGFAFRAGNGKLDDKIEFWRSRADILRFADFGTRRRFGRKWQFHIDSRLANELSPNQFLGTSNVYNAMELGITPIGNIAHQQDMVKVALASQRGPEAMRQAVFEVRRTWLELYGFDLSIGLPDTYGSEFFFENAPLEAARDWKGQKGDSGDLMVFGDRLVAWYKRHGQDPREKVYVPCDGLDCERQDRITRHMAGRIKVASGIGTHLTNDVVGDPISIVDKPIGVRVGDTLIPTCKLSDNPAKAQGALAEEYKKVFNYLPHKYEECLV